MMKRPRKFNPRRAITLAETHRLACLAQKQCEICHQPCQVREYPEVGPGGSLRCRCEEHKEA